jgi:hypothetical protein
LTPGVVRAETTVYFVGYAMSVPPPVVLFVCGVALVAIGIGLRKFFKDATQAAEPELDLKVDHDGNFHGGKFFLRCSE